MAFKSETTKGKVTGTSLEIIKVVMLLIIYIPYKAYRLALVGSIVPPMPKKRPRPVPPKGQSSKRVYYVVTEESWGLVHSPTSNLALKTLRDHYDDKSRLVLCRYAVADDFNQEMRFSKERLVADK